MSCGGGNRFACGIRRFDKHSFAPDKPSNPELFNEQQKRLSDLLRQREEQDKGVFQPMTDSTQSVPDSNLALSDTTYTPWTTPSATNPK